MFSTSPASSPPSTTRPQLILPIVTSGREKCDQHAAPTVGADATAVKQLASGYDQHGHHPTQPIRNRRHPVGHDPVRSVDLQIEMVQPTSEHHRAFPNVIAQGSQPHGLP